MERVASWRCWAFCSWAPRSSSSSWYVVWLTQNAISLPYIHGLYFFKFTSLANTQQIMFGTWSICSKQEASGYQCTGVSLGYQNGLSKLQSDLQRLGINPFVNKDLAYALVLQPISAGFAGLAAGAGLLAVCANSLLFTLTVFWATVLAIATLIVELVLFVKAHKALQDGLVSSGNESNLVLKYGPSLWMQVAATAAMLVGFLFLFRAWSKNRASKEEDTYQAPLPSYTRPEDNYAYGTPAQSYPRYDQPNPTSVYADPGQEQQMVTSTGTGRAYDAGQPYEAPHGVSARNSMVYDPLAAGGVVSRRHSRADDDRRQSYHSRRSSRRNSQGNSQAHARHHSGRSHRVSRSDVRARKDTDYDYDMPTHSRSDDRARSHRRRHTEDSYEDAQERPRRASRAYTEDTDPDLYADARETLPGRRYKRYNDRGAF